MQKMNSMTQEYLAKQKASLFKELRESGIRDEAVLKAMETVPRETFMPIGLQGDAYYNAAFPIGQGQTISQPYIVAFMTEKLELTPNSKVLEVGTGSGYQAAILSRLVKGVYTIERHKPLLERAEGRFKLLGYNNIHTHCGDGSKGWKEEAPFDRIIVTAAARHIPEVLVNQLNIGGMMVIPVDNGTSGQELVRMTKTSTGVTKESMLAVIFVPLVEE